MGNDRGSATLTGGVTNGVTPARPPVDFRGLPWTSLSLPAQLSRSAQTHGMEEVRGWNPLGSTVKDLVKVGLARVHQTSGAASLAASQ